MVYNTRTKKWESKSERNADILSDYVIIVKDPHEQFAQSVFYANDYGDALRIAHTTSDYYEVMGMDYSIGIYESCEKQRRERT